MKKILSFILILSLVFTAVACSSTTNESSSSNDDGQVSKPMTEEEIAAEAAAKEAEDQAKTAEAEKIFAEAEKAEAVKAAEEANAAAEQAAAEKAEAEKLLAEAKSTEEKAAAEKFLAEKVAAEQAAAEAASQALAQQAAAEKAVAAATAQAAAQKAASEKAAAEKAAAEKAASQSKGTASSQPTVDPKKVVKLNFWGAIPPETGPQELVDNWNKAFPEIQVTYTRFVNNDSGNTQLEAALMAGNVDVFINYSWAALQKRIEGKLLEPIDPYLQRDKLDLTKEFGEHPYTVGGKHYFIPTLGGPGTFTMYNKDMTDAAGIVIPEKWTYDEFMEIAKKLTKGEGANKVWGSINNNLVGNNWSNPVLMYLNGDYLFKPGKNETNFDHPAFLKALKIKHQMENVDKTQIPLIEMNSKKIDIAAEFTKGRVAIINNAAYTLRDIKNLEKYPHTFKTAFTSTPMLYPDQNFLYSGGLREWISISPKTPYKDEAWLFLKYYATKGYGPMALSARIVPAWKPGQDLSKNLVNALGPDYAKIFDTNSFVKRFKDSSLHRDLVTNRIETSASKIIEMMEIEAQKALLDQQSLEDAIKNMKSKGDAILQQK